MSKVTLYGHDNSYHDFEKEKKDLEEAQNLYRNTAQDLEKSKSQYHGVHKNLKAHNAAKEDTLARLQGLDIKTMGDVAYNAEKKRLEKELNNILDIIKWLEGELASKTNDLQAKENEFSLKTNDLQAKENDLSKKESDYEQSNYDQALEFVLENNPYIREKYDLGKYENSKEALGFIIKNVYDKNIAENNNSNLLEYKTIMQKLDSDRLKEEQKQREQKLKKESNNDIKYEDEIKKIFNDQGGYPTADIDHLTFSGKPVWYNNFVKNIAIRTAKLTNPEKSYPYYNKPRIAKSSKEEDIAYDLLSKNLLGPEYKETFKKTIEDLEDLKTESPTQNLSDADKRAEEKTTNENIEDYVNPKTNSVLDLIQKRALRNFKENIMPKVSAPFIARGSFNTGARAEAQARARRDLMEGLMDSETQFLANAYDKARETASTDKKTYLNYRLSKAGLENDEIIRKGKIAEDINKLLDTNHKNKLLDMEALRTVGQNRRDVEQQDLNLKYEEFKNQEDYPLRQVDILNKMVHQLPVGSIIGETSNKSSPPTRNEQVSPWQTGAGLFGQMAAMNMMNKAEGGMIQRHANGGMIDKMKDQYLQDLMTRAQNTGGNTQNPWAHYMLGLSNSLASSRNPDVISALGEGSTKGVGQFMHAKEYNKGLEDQNLGFKKSIIDYLDQADERKMANRLNEAKINYYNNKGNILSNGSIKSAIPATVQRITAQTLKQLDNEAQIAKEENKLLPKSEESLEQMKEATSTFTKPGTLASKLVDEYKFLENIIYNEEAQKARQEIEKNNSLLIQNRAAPGTNPTDASRQIIASGMPRTTIQPEASAEIFRSKREQNTDKELRSKFIHEWVKQAGGDINGAQDAYNEFIRDKELLKNGKPNYEIMKEIPSAVYHYITETPFSIEQESNITSHNNEEYGFDPSDYDDIPDEVILHRLESGQ